MFNVVVALDQKRGIGHDGRLPWKLAGDTRFFRELTTCPDRAAVERRYGLIPNPPAVAESLETFLARLKATAPLPMPTPDRRNAVLMGRNTWEGLPLAFKPLPNRLNGVLSRQGTQGGSGTHRVWGDLDQAFEELNRDESVSEVFVIGGAQIYAEALQSPACARIYTTIIAADFPCDVFFPEIPAGFKAAATSAGVEEDGLRYRFRLFERATPR